MSKPTPVEQQFSHKLIEQSPDAIIFAGLQGTIRVWNAAAERAFSFSAEIAIGSVAHARDINERFTKDRAMRKRLKALEVDLTK